MVSVALSIAPPVDTTHADAVANVQTCKRCAHAETRGPANKSSVVLVASVSTAKASEVLSRVTPKPRQTFCVTYVFDVIE